MDIFGALLGFLIIALAVRGIYKGEVIGEWFNRIKKEDDLFSFWFRIVLYIIVGLLCLTELLPKLFNDYFY